jgi:hypothetical protein
MKGLHLLLGNTIAAAESHMNTITMHATAAATVIETLAIKALSQQGTQARKASNTRCRLHNSPVDSLHTKQAQHVHNADNAGV